MVGTISPLVERASRTSWYRAAAAYTIGSMSSSVVAGAMLGLLGATIHIRLHVATLVLIGAAALLSLTEAMDAGERFHPIHRQTRKHWYAQFGPTRASFMWGADLGVGFTTRVYFLSFWLIVLACLVLGSLTLGTFIFGAYGLGRSLLILTGPLLIRRTGPLDLVPQLIQSRHDWHIVHAVLLLATALGLVAALLRSTGASTL